MKTFFKTILIFILFAVIPINAHAVAPTPSGKITPTLSTKNAATDAADLDRIQKIKEMVAKKVKQLNLVEKRVILGKVKDTSSTQISIEDRHGDSRTIDIDELTKFEQIDSSTKTPGVSDIKTGDTLAFVGLYNKDTKRLLARFVIKVASIPERFEGVITEKDVKKFTLTVVNEKGVKKVVDIGASTKIWVYEKDDFVKSGFSKVTPGQRIFAVGFYDQKDSKLLLASRITYFTSIPPSNNMKRFEKVETEEVQVSTGSGKKLTPLTR